MLEINQGYVNKYFDKCTKNVLNSNKFTVVIQDFVRYRLPFRYSKCYLKEDHKSHPSSCRFSVNLVCSIQTKKLH